MIRKNNAHPEAIKIFEEHQKQIENAMSQKLQELNCVLLNSVGNWEAKILDSIDLLIDLNRGRQEFKKITGALKNSDKYICEPVKYQTSSLFLIDCSQFLTTDPKLRERMHLVTGTVTEDRIRILSRMENFNYKSQSAGYVCGEIKETHVRITSLSHDFGHPLLAVFHSHTSKGALATKPSGTDLNFLERQLKMRCDLVSGIFSLDGFIRFISLKAFELDVYGKGIKKIEDSHNDKLFQIIGKGER